MSFQSVYYPKRILFSLLLLSLVACGQNPKKYVMNPEAKILSDSAYNFVRYNFDTSHLRSAINLLQQSTAIDSNNITGIRNILSYQLMLKDYNSALITSKRLVRLRPLFAEFQTAVGITYELLNDSISSKPYFEKAVSIYSSVLDTLKDKEQVKMAKSFKAYNLIFLNDNEGQVIIRDLIKNSKDTLETEALKEYLNKSKQDILKMYKNENKESDSEN